MFIVMIVLMIVTAVNRDSLMVRHNYSFSSVNSAFYGNSGRIYAIDNGRENIIILDNEGKVSEVLGGGREGSFYYAEELAEGDDGSLYILDEAYSGEEGDTETSYRILQYIDKKYRVLLLSESQKIYDLQYKDGKLYYLREEEYGLGFYGLKPNDAPGLYKRIFSGDILNDATIDLSTELCAIATKRGAVRLQYKDSYTWDSLKASGIHIMPRSITARNGIVYFSELYSGSIASFPEDSLDSFNTLYSEEDLKIDSVNAKPDGSSLLASDLKSFYRINMENGPVTVNYQGDAENSRFYFTVIMWICLILSVLILLYFLKFIPGILKNLIHNEASLRMSAVVVAVVMVSGFIASSLISEERVKEDDRDITDMKLFSEVMLDCIDKSSLSKIRWEYDYMGSAYMKFRDSADMLVKEAEKQGQNYIYVFYDLSDGCRYILNYEDTVMCGEPRGKADHSIIQECFESGKSFATKSRDAEGSWLSILSRVSDDNGNPVAVMEISTDLNFKEQERARQTRDTIMNVLCSSAVMMMLIIEALFLISFYEENSRDSVKKKDAYRAVPLRTVMALTYLAQAMQDPFITVLASRLYKSSFPIPDSVAAGLPLTAQLFMMAIASFVVGNISEKADSKQLLYTGFFIDIAGYVVCTLFCQSYIGIIAGNVLSGAGTGVLLVSCNTLAARGETLESTAEGFSGIMAGSLSGFTMGAGLSALIFPIGGVRLAYAVAAGFMVPVLFMIYFSENVKPEIVEKASEKDKIGFFKFFVNPRVLGFFAFILVPFMMTISYREYFFPLYVMGHGMDEVKVGQLFLVCGLLVIYIGPYISSWVIKKFGTFWSVVFASVIMGANLILSGLFLSVLTVIAGVVILSLCVSFAYTCLYTYFEQLPDSLMYGDGKAMGVYSVFENLGQTIGPTVYGSLMLMGERKGMLVFGVVVLFFVLCYIIAMNREKRFFH
ncbi:MAG: MFS transporter [Lachnospiraceae bacterium]|nr:MFS transporter [Lachnospiraceae bacterium]